MRIEIEDVKTDLERDVYTFWIVDFNLILDSYKVQFRESKKHKFKNLKTYERIDKRNSTMKLSDFEIPSYIEDDVKEMVKNKLVVLKGYSR